MQKIVNPNAHGKTTYYQVKLWKPLFNNGYAALVSILNSRKASGLPRANVVKYLQLKSSYTKHEQFTKIFVKRKVIGYRVNKVLSIDWLLSKMFKSIITGLSTY